MTKNINAVEILNSKNMRDEMIDRADVLDKVKALLLIPKLEVMTTRQVAEYYEVEVEAIQRVYQRHRSEIDSDGASLLTPKAFSNEHVVHLKTGKGFVSFDIGDGEIFTLPTRGTHSFSKRAILRIGMLLRDSKIAEEIRTQLLNTVEKATPEQIVLDIDKENELIMSLGRACALGTKEDVMEAARAYNVFKDRHIAQLNEAISDLKASNKVLASEILTWDNRSILNKAVRTIALSSGKYIGTIWNELYSELNYKHHIGLKQRGKSPYLNHIKNSEWPFVQQSLAAIAEKYGVSIANIVEEHSANGLGGFPC